MKEFICIGCQGVFPHKGYSYAGKFCTNQCQGLYRQRQWFIDKEKDFLEGTLTSRAAIKRFILKRDGNKCAICNSPPMHNNKPLIMILDHIDGDASNNLPINFRLVCPNCDTQLPTYKSRNRGNGRATKGLKWYSRI